MAYLPGGSSIKTKTMVIKAGETGVIPSTAKIISVGILGGADAESDCVSVEQAIANAEPYACFEFVWEVSTSGSWDETSVIVEAIELDGSIYEIGEKVSDIDQTPGLIGKIKQAVPSSIMKLGDNVKGQAWYDQLGGGNITHAICFRALPTIAEKLRLKISNNMANGNEGGDPIYYIYPRDLSKISQGTTWCTCIDTVNPSA